MDDAAAAVAEARIGENVAVAAEASVVAAADVACRRRTIARMWRMLAFGLDLYDG